MWSWGSGASMVNCKSSSSALISKKPRAKGRGNPNALLLNGNCEVGGSNQKENWNTRWSNTSIWGIPGDGGAWMRSLAFSRTILFSNLCSLNKWMSKWENVISREELGRWSKKCWISPNRSMGMAKRLWFRGLCRHFYDNDKKNK